METNPNKSDNGENEQKPECFVMMPISTPKDNYEVDHFNLVYQQIFKPAIENAGYTPKRVDENLITDSIIFKIFNYIQKSSMALCDLSSRNPNVLYELGIRQAYDMPVVLVQDDVTDKIFDVSGISTVQYCHERFYENVMQDRQNITKALLENQESSNDSSLVKIIGVAKASQGETSSPSRDDILNYRFQTIQNQLMDLNISLQHQSINSKMFAESKSTTPIALNIRPTINKTKDLLNKLKCMECLSIEEYHMYTKDFNHLQNLVEDAELSKATYDHFKSLFGSIANELSRLSKTL